MTTMATHGGTTSVADVVDLRVPAVPAYLAVIRTATAGLAARLDLTLDEIAEYNIDKLYSRLERGTIKGDGDNR